MSWLDAWLVVHLLLLTYWLGGDLGVFYSSRWVLKPELSVESRTTALKIMGWLDMAPKACMVLFLPSGVTLMSLDPRGSDLVTTPRVLLVWLFAFAWLGLVVADYRSGHGGSTSRVKQLDLAVRIGLVLGLVGTAAYTLVADEPFGVHSHPRWLGGKVLAYALTIACGIGIRLQLRAFGPAYARLVTEGSSPEVEAVLRRSIARCVPLVLAIWVLILVAAVLGVAKPGMT